MENDDDVFSEKPKVILRKKRLPRKVIEYIQSLSNALKEYRLFTIPIYAYSNIQIRLKIETAPSNTVYNTTKNPV